MKRGSPKLLSIPLKQTVLNFSSLHKLITTNRLYMIGSGFAKKLLVMRMMLEMVKPKDGIVT